MENQLKVSLENIIPLTFARDHFSQIVTEVQKDKLFVLTKGGKPAVAIIDVKYLESITGGQIQKADIDEEIKKAPEKVGLPPMVEHPSSPPRTELSDKGSGQVSKPAGFAAPSFASSDAKAMEDKKATEGNPQPQPAPSPKPPPPPIPKPSPPPMKSIPPISPPPPSQPRADQPRVKKTEPAKSPGLVMPEEKSEAAGQTNQVNVEFAPDHETMAKQTAEDKIPDIEKVAPDDKNPPAQYAGEKEEPEPDDMALD